MTAFYRRLGGVWSASDRYLGCPKFGTAPARCERCPTGHRPNVDIFIGYVRVKSNSMPARFPNRTRQPQWVPWGRGRKCLEIRRKLLANPSHANCKSGITYHFTTTYIINIVIRELQFKYALLWKEFRKRNYSSLWNAFQMKHIHNWKNTQK